MLFCIPFLNPFTTVHVVELHLLGFGLLLESGKNEKPFSIVFFWGGGGILYKFCTGYGTEGHGTEIIVD